MDGSTRLQEIGERFGQLAEHWPDMVYRMSLPDGRYEYVGRASTEIVGYSPEQFFSSPRLIREFIHPEWIEYLDEQWEALLAGDMPPFYEYQIIHGRSGETRWVMQRNLLVRDDDGRPVAIEGIVTDATERKQAEEALRNEKELTEAAWDAQRDTFFLFEPDTGRAVRWNRAFKEITGYSDEEIAEMPAPTSYYSPEDLEKISDFLQQLLEAKTGRIELDLICKDGRKVPTEYNVSVVRDKEGAPRYLISVGRDISERKSAEEEVQRARERMAGFMDSASESFHLVDSHFGIIEINERAMQALRGVVPGIETREDVIGRTLLDVYPFMQGEGGEFQFRNVVETGKSMKFDGAAEHPVHGTVHMTVQAFKVGNDLGIIATDISDRKRAEEKRLDLERQTQHAQKLESLGVLGGTDLALQHVTPTSPARELLEDVTKVANRAADLANQLLAYSGKGRFIVEPTDLSVLVEEMFQLIETSVSKKIRIAYELDDDLPATEVDATQIRQIALNLVINAAEAIGEGVGTVSLATGSLQCDREYLAKAYPGDEAEEGRYVYLEVKDSGAGMDSETVQRIFDPFFTTKTTGRGLGLAAALGIVRGHQGAFRVESQPGLGTTMTVLLPASETTAINRPRRPEEQGDWQGSGVVLLVDDEEMVRTVAEAMLGRLGFEVLVAKDGRQGVEAFRQHADEIALVLLDMTMPEMNGDDACQEIMRIKSDARVLLSSGFHEQDVTGKFATSGLAGFIQKPYRLDDLAQTIREILDS